MAAQDLPKAPKKQEFSLKPVETALLGVINQQHTTMMASTLSFIAVERLAYQVTDNTAFEVAADGKSVKIWENEPAPQVAPVQTDTAKAVKGAK